MTKKPLYLLYLLTLSAGLTSCVTPPMYDDIQEGQSKANKKIQDHPAVVDRNHNIVNIKCEPYVDPTPQSLKHAPAWLKQHVTLKGRSLPFDFYMKDLLKGTDGLVAYQNNEIKNMILSFDYSGSLDDALDYMSVQSNYGYELKDRTIEWSRLMTKTFQVAFVPGEVSYLLGQTSGASAGGGGGGSGAGGGQSASSGSMIVTGSTDMSSQYTNISGKLSIWDDLKETIKNLLSPEGRMTISQSTTSITIQDRPANVRSVETYLNQLNKELSRQVLIRVQVIEFTAKQGFDYGINWNLIAGSLGVQGLMAQPVTIAGFDSTSIPALSWVILPTAVTAQKAGGPPSPTQAFLSALNQQGHTSVVTEPSVISLNNQVAEIYINTQTGYLAQVTTTVTGTSGTSQTALTPGIVNSGFVIDVLPKIQGKNIYLQLTTSISNPPSFSTASSGSQTISTPTIDEKRFNQRSVIPSGGTLVLSGYKQITNKTAKNSFLGTGLLGGVGGSNNTGETILLITPTILGNDNE